MEGDLQDAAGYRMPAEWSPHQATWISWPHNTGTWPGHLPGVERTMAEAVGALAGSELVRINVRDADMAIMYKSCWRDGCRRSA